jgi:hypothetical protein
MGENLGNNFVGDKEGHSWGHNGENKELGWAYVRILLDLLDVQTYKMPRSDKPGSTGRESYKQFPEEADYRGLGLPRDVEGSTAWYHQGNAAEDRDSNRRSVEGSMFWEAHSRPHASTPVPAQPAVLGLGFRMRGNVWHC